MTALDLLTTQIEDGTFQLRKVFEGIDDSLADAKPLPVQMSFREMVVHVAEAYQATLAEGRGEKHSWGSFTLPADNFADLMSKFFALRDEAIASVLAQDEETAVKTGSAFLVGHDYYHVGQAATLRLVLTPDWNPYSIYNH